jgi:carbamoyltransferase
MFLLGMSAFGDGSAACLLHDGVPLAAAFEERFSRAKHDSALPLRAVRSCLRLAGIEPHQLERVVFYEKPLRRFERILASQLGNFPRSSGPFANHMFLWLGERLWLKGQLSAELGVPMERIGFVGHQLSHAAASFYASGFDEAAVLCVDGQGEWECTTLFHGRGRELVPLRAVNFPHSLGLLTSAVAQFLGFIPGADDHKLGELAALGQPRFASAFEQLLKLLPDGGYAADLSAFRFAFDEQQLFTEALERLLGPRRVPGAPLRAGGGDMRDADVAASLWRRLEQVLNGLLGALRAQVPSRNLCLAGALSLDPWLNAQVVARGWYERVFAQPAGKDAGAALGAALYAWHAALGKDRHWTQRHTFLGEAPTFVGEEPPKASAGKQAPLPAEADAWGKCLAERLAAGQIVGLVRGRFEYAQRSLGNRSLLAAASLPDAKQRLNTTLKRREEFRPYAVAIPAARANEWFEIPPAGFELARYKLLAVRARPGTRQRFPALAHADGTCVVQLVDAQHDARFERTLDHLGRSTSLPAAFCAALNARGDPPVRGEQDARALFERSSIDALVVEDVVHER